MMVQGQLVTVKVVGWKPVSIIFQLEPVLYTAILGAYRSEIPVPPDLVHTSVMV